MVYFISNGCDIKIGFTNQPLKHRLQQLKTGSSERLFIVGKIDSGNLELEKKIHKMFRVKNLEWHYSDDNLIEYINKYGDMNVMVDKLDGKVYVFKKMSCV